MGSILFDFLTESYLFRDELIETRFSSLTDADLRNELRRYREFCVARLAALKAEAVQETGTFKVFGGSSRISRAHLTQMAFYVQQYVIQDPLFPLTHEQGEAGRVMNAYMGLEKPEMDRGRLVEALRYLRWLTPMVAANYVKLLPVSYLFEPPAQLPLYASDNYFADVLPNDVMTFFRNRAVVRPLEKTPEGLRILDNLGLCRHICVDFEGHDDSEASAYLLLAPEFTRIDERTRTFEALMTLPEEPPSQEEFEVWVQQSVHQAAKKLHDRIFEEVYLSNQCNAQYLTPSRFVLDLLQFDRSGQSIETNSANLLLQFALPAFTDVDPIKLMSVRRDNGEAFQAFRSELDRHFRELRNEQDELKLRMQVENALHELTEIQLRAVKAKFRELTRSAFLNAAVMVGSLVSSINTSGMSLGAAWLAAANGVKLYTEYRSSVHQNPAFFLWKVLK